jgi:hypothetical protein
MAAVIPLRFERRRRERNNPNFEIELNWIRAVREIVHEPVILPTISHTIPTAIATLA